MVTTGVAALDTAVHRTNSLLNEIGAELGVDDHQRAYLALRTVLHTLRDRLTIAEAADLGAQLSLLVRGVFYEGWRPSQVPLRLDKSEFLRRVAAGHQDDLNFDAERVVRAVFKVLEQHISRGEIADVQAQLPREFHDLWASA